MPIGKRRLFSAMAAVVPCLTAAKDCLAAPMTGRQLLAWCEQDREKADVYIAAFNDTAQMARLKVHRAAEHAPRNATTYDESFHRLIGRFCLPRRTAIPASQIVCHWLSTHDDVLAMTAPQLIARSYRQLYPCLDE